MSAALNHPNVAAIFGVEESADVLALVLELVDGPTLADRIEQGPLLLDELLPIASQLADALESAHEQGVIHRDLKPANIKIRPDGTGGLQPGWSRDGRELFYRQGDALMAVPVQLDPFRAGAPQTRLDMPRALYSLDPYMVEYDVAADGRVITVRRGGVPEIHVVLTWAENCDARWADDGYVAGGGRQPD